MIPYRFLEHDWFWYAGGFRYPAVAKSAWEALDNQLAGKGLDLGTYRHGPSTDPGTRVTAISHRPDGVLRARRILRRFGARDLPLDELGPAELEAVIARRIRFVHEQLASGDSRSHTTIRREGPGARLHRDGTMDE